MLADMTHPSLMIHSGATQFLTGVWRAVTTDAPYPDHLFTFNSDGTFIIHNPTNVEQNTDLSGINDSAGMGTWRHTRSIVHGSEAGGGMTHTFEGSFVQLNAAAATHLPAPDLHVAFRVEVHTATPDRFDGNAAAQFGTGPVQKTALTGVRESIDEALLAQVTR